MNTIIFRKLWLISSLTILSFTAMAQAPAPKPAVAPQLAAAPQKAEQPELLLTTPVVYLLKGEYQIVVPVTAESLVWLKVGDKTYYDDFNGVLRSRENVHKICVPQAVLDAAKRYTVCYRRVTARKAYFTKTQPAEERTFEFKPIPADAQTIRLYQIADAHNRVESPAKAASYFGDNLDLLVFNGDIMNESQNLLSVLTVFKLAAKITGGRIPVVFARGNHDLRGIYAEKLGDSIPLRNGATFFSFRAGSLWGLVLDVGEDKADGHAEYGHTLCCHAFRERQTAYIRDVIRRAAEEYAAPGVRHRVVIAHQPLYKSYVKPDWAITQEWMKLLKEHIHPELILSAHEHGFNFTELWNKPEDHAQPCLGVVASRPEKDQSRFAGAGVVFSPEKIEILFTDQDHKIIQRRTVPQENATDAK